VRTGKEALNLLASDKFDLVLKDHEPPHSDASRLLRTVNSTEMLVHVPVLGACPRCP
jgi:CheY-like chemotaxis protein